MVDMKRTVLAFVILSVLGAVLGTLPVASAYSDVGISVENEKVSTCPCSTIETGDIGIEIENLGDTNETYKLSLEFPDPDSWSGFITPEITVPAGEKVKIDAVFVTPSCSVVPGTYLVGFVVDSEISGKVFRKNVTVDVLKCHWFGVEAEEFELCYETGAFFDFDSFEIDIINEGKSYEKANVTVKESWVELSESEIEIESGEKMTLEMIFSPSEKEIGTNEITLTVESLTSYAVVEKVIKVDVKKCYAYDITITPSIYNICPCNTANFTLEINNTGLGEDDYEISHENLTSNMTLLPGEAGKMQIYVDVPCKREGGNYTTTLKVDSRYDSWEAPLNVIVVSKEECYLLDVNATEMKVTVGVGKSVTYDLEIGNSGKFTDVYDLVLDSPDWVYISADRVEIMPGDEVTVYLYVAPDHSAIPGNYTASLLVSSDMEESMFKMEIEVVSDFPVVPVNVTNETGMVEEANETNTSPETENIVNMTNDTGESAGENITMNMSIPTGAFLADGSGEERPWSHVILVSLLAVGVVIILVIRFVILIK